MADSLPLDKSIRPATPSTPTLPPAGVERVGADIDYGRFLDCVHCGLCTSACPTYLETGNENDSPRGRIYLMRAVTDGRLELGESVKRHLDLCLDCRSCETACPSGVQYGRLIEPFRVDMRRAERNQVGTDVSKRGSGPPWLERMLLYGLFPYPGRMRAALAPARWLQRTKLDRLIDRSGLPRLLPGFVRRMYDQLPRLQPSAPAMPELLPAIGPRRARVGLFAGCVAQAMFPQTNWATARVLQANGCDVVIPKSQVCCGAIHYHSGAEGPALEFAARNAAAFDVASLDAVIVNVAGCGSMLKDYGHIAEEAAVKEPSPRPSPIGMGEGEENPRPILMGRGQGEGSSPAKSPTVLGQFASKVRDVSEFLAELGPIPPPGELRLRAVYHDACHLVHAQRVREQPRSLLALVPGLELVPLPESEVCCGAAGSYNLTEPEMSERLSQRKLHNILSCTPQAVITGNAGCSLQIQAALRRIGSPIWVAHPMDVLDLSYRKAQPPTT
ncbi:MAG TPA: heterodisulfide reductase-related iron-sulfur binding cluster [Planctomycetaceae bacterium]|nr:heterodisulfide reductase-related iron-sulfur binding cluster [Planctomycetaceae bacterium]